MASIPSSETIPVITPSVSAETTPAAPVTIPIPPAVPEDVSGVHQTAAAPPSNPEILRFVKMLAVGVPLMAVEQKMRAEGYDPALLNSSKVPATSVPSRADHSSDEEESNSDED